MKPVLLLTLIALCLSSCKKSETISPGLFGSWELRSIVGGIAGIDSTYKAGNGKVFQFKSDSTYVQKDKNKVLAQGTFYIRIPNLYSTNSAKPVVEIYFNNNASGDLFILNGTSLTIGQDYDDGFASAYEKIGN